MAHFAELDSNNTVKRVIVVNNSDIMGSDGKESEQLGIDLCSRLLGGTWKQTSYNASFRKNYAGIGSTYDETRDAFVAPQPHPSWTLDESTCQWQPPVPYPADGQFYTWSEAQVNWVAA